MAQHAHSNKGKQFFVLTAKFVVGSFDFVDIQKGKISPLMESWLQKVESGVHICVCVCVCVCVFVCVCMYVCACMSACVVIAE